MPRFNGTRVGNRFGGEPVEQRQANLSEFITRGASLGLSDYVGAGGRYLGGQAADFLTGRDDMQSFGQALDLQRGDIERRREQNPVMATGLEIGGAIASPGARAIQRGFEPLTRLFGPIGRYAGYGGTGATIGATQSAATGNPEDVIDNMIKGGVLGAVFGIGGAGVVEGLGAIASRTVVPAFLTAWDSLPFRGKEIAIRKIQQALRRDGVDLDEQQIMAKLSRLGDDSVVADLGPNTAALLKRQAQRPGLTKQYAEDILDPRNKQLGENLMGSVQRNISSKNFVDEIDNLQRVRSVQADPLYKEAAAAFPDDIASSRNIARIIREGGVSGPQITQAQKDLMRYQRLAGEKGSPLGRIIRAGFNNGRKVLKAESERAGTAFDESLYGKGLPYWDAVKRGLDDILRDGTNGTTNKFGKLTAFGQKVKGLRDDLVEHLDTLTTVNGQSAYAKARAAWAGPSRLLDVMDDGMNFAKGKRADVLRRADRLSPDETEAFLAGMSEEMQTAIGKTGKVPPLFKNLMNEGSTTRKQLLRILPKDRFDDFLNDIEASVIKANTSNKVRGGSETFENFAGASDDSLDISGALVELGTGNVGAGAATASRGFMSWLRNPTTPLPEPVRDDIGRKLLSGDSNTVRRIVQQAEAAGISADQLYQMLGVVPRAGGAITPGFVQESR